MLPASSRVPGGSFAGLERLNQAVLILRHTRIDLGQITGIERRRRQA